MSSTNKYRKQVDKLLGKVSTLEDQLVAEKKKVSKLKKSVQHHEQAKELIKLVSLQTQQKISYNIGEITSLALDSVLEKPYELKIEFVERRGKTECDIWFERDGTRITPFSGGGGAVDVAAFALRVASWSMSNPRSRNVLILDEPFKHLKGEEVNKKMLEMVKEISTRLNIQVLMVSDERVSRQATQEATDQLLESSIRKGITKLTEQ